MKILIKRGDRVYATGVFLRRSGKTWRVVSFEDDTYFDGEYVEDIEGEPYIEDEPYVKPRVIVRDWAWCSSCIKLGETICPGKPNTDCYEGR